jgi:hypothetical protein
MRAAVFDLMSLIWDLDRLPIAVAIPKILDGVERRGMRCSQAVPALSPHRFHKESTGHGLAPGACCDNHHRS